jgi:hypothetical protein
MISADFLSAAVITLLAPFTTPKEATQNSTEIIVTSS